MYINIPITLIILKLVLSIEYDTSSNRYIYFFKVVEPILVWDVHCLVGDLVRPCCLISRTHRSVYVNKCHTKSRYISYCFAKKYIIILFSLGKTF